MKTCRSFLRLLPVCFALILPATALALNVQWYRPGPGTISGVQVFTSETLPKHHFSLGFSLNLDMHPLGRQTAGTSGTTGVVDQFITADALASYAFTDWLNVNLDVPFNLFRNIGPVFIPSRDMGVDLGDILVNAKFQLLDANKEEHKHFGIALIPFMTFPSGSNANFMGDTNVTGGVTLAADKKLGDHRLYVNFGTRFREEETIDTQVFGHEFLYGAGYQMPLVRRWDLDVIGEIFGSTTYRKFLNDTNTTPVELYVHLQKRWMESKKLVTRLGGSAGLTEGYGSPDYRVMTSVAYEFGKGEEAPAPPPRSKKVIKLKGQVHFKLGKAVIEPASYAVLDDLVKKIEARPAVRLIQVEGHTDSQGSDAYNQGLSDRRAAAVVKYLVDHGISASRLKSAGFGESQPIADNATPEGRQKNRRVVVTILQED